MSYLPQNDHIRDGLSDIYQRIVFEVADGIIGVDEGGVIRLCNPSAEQMFGWPPGQLLGQPLDVLLPDQVRPRHAHYISEFAKGDADARYMNQRPSAVRGRRADGTEISLSATILRTQAAAGRMMIAVLRDVTNAVSHQRELQRLADLDSLTGLKNRRAFLELAEKVLERSREAEEPLGVALLDLDHFKSINDTHGHSAGDRVLEGFGKILTQLSRRQDLVARWGGEEFILLLPRTDLGLACVAVERIRSEVERFTFRAGASAHDEAIHVTMSAGIAARSAPSDTLRDMINRADAALYDAKRLGRNRIETAGNAANPQG